MHSAPASAADPFDAGPYARLQAALARGRLIARPGRRALAVAGLAWLPLLVLAAIQGHALGGRPHEALLLDVSAYARYLVAVPALLLAEVICLPRLAMIAHHFVEARLVTEADHPRFDSLIASTRGLLESRRVEIILVIVAYMVTLASANSHYPASVSSWVAPIADGRRVISLAGWWRLLVSQPIFVLLMVAWLWRLAAWARFLWKISLLDLQIVPAHPDLAGGLRFVGTSLRAFMPVAFGLGAAAAGVVAEGMLFDGRPPEAYLSVPVSLIVLVLVLFVSPMLVLSRPLLRARLRGTFAYGELADALGKRFEQRWLARGANVDDDALSAPDFSATTDLYSIAANVRAMRPIPFDLMAVVALLAAALLPFLPLVFTVVSPREVLKLAAKLVL